MSSAWMISGTGTIGHPFWRSFKGGPKMNTRPSKTFMTSTRRYALSIRCSTWSQTTPRWTLASSILRWPPSWTSLHWPTGQFLPTSPLCRESKASTLRDAKPRKRLLLLLLLLLFFFPRWWCWISSLIAPASQIVSLEEREEKKRERRTCHTCLRRRMMMKKTMKTKKMEQKKTWTRAWKKLTATLKQAWTCSSLPLPPLLPMHHHHHHRHRFHHHRSFPQALQLPRSRNCFLSLPLLLSPNYLPHLHHLHHLHHLVNTQLLTFLSMWTPLHVDWLDCMCPRSDGSVEPGGRLRLTTWPSAIPTSCVPSRRLTIQTTTPNLWPGTSFNASPSFGTANTPTSCWQQQASSRQATTILVSPHHHHQEARRTRRTAAAATATKARCKGWTTRPPTWDTAAILWMYISTSSSSSSSNNNNNNRRRRRQQGREAIAHRGEQQHISQGPALETRQALLPLPLLQLQLLLLLLLFRRHAQWFLNHHTEEGPNLATATTNIIFIINSRLTVLANVARWAAAATAWWPPSSSIKAMPCCHYPPISLLFLLCTRNKCAPPPKGCGADVQLSMIN